ncbi:MAG: DNA/RNA non-specific endonuclease [Rhodocyclaceae bacterium]|nr:DNA/RNA non-specific endonuclease [Rhodocyclaceae bacterium]
MRLASIYTSLRQSFFVALIACLVLAASPAVSRTCTADEKAEADKKLWLNKRDTKAVINRHLPWGLPESTTSNDSIQVLAQRDYVIGYDLELRVPLWTAHRLSAKGLGKNERVDCFRRDPRINAPAASLPSDYKEPIFDQGHLTPNGDMSKGLVPVINSFVMSNMAPQFCQFNRGVWQILEALIRVWVKDKPPLYVVTGSVFDHDGNGQPDANADVPRMKSLNGKERVAMPSHFYKIVIHQQEGGTVDALAFLMPHDMTDVAGDEAIQYIERHLKTIEDIETIAGLKLFPDVAGRYPQKATSLWELEGTVPRSLVDDRCRATADLPR